MAVITREYLDYLDQKERINLEREAEFLLIAALLIHIKSQMLLPRESVSEGEEDPRQALVERLLDHQKIKAACSILREKENDQMQTWQRTVLPPLTPTDEMEFIEVSLFDLAEVFFSIMKRKERESVKVIQGRGLSVKDKVDEIIQHLKTHGYLDFLEYFEQSADLQEALLSFFCLLELIKSRTIFAAQESLFSPIKVWLRQKEPKT
jgi:segregation and condensation protein A